MIPELQDDLINFSFIGLQDAIKNIQRPVPGILFYICMFIPFFLAGLKKLVCFYCRIPCIFTYLPKQPLSEAAHISQTHQVDFDRLICHVLEKIYPFPGFTLLLGSILQRMTKNPRAYSSGVNQFLYLIVRHGHLNLAEDSHFWEIIFD
jgi:hypothetical protein